MTTVPGDMEVICPVGDMLLSCTTNGEIRRFKVSSQTLCTASDVFRAMLGPTSKFKEATELRTAGDTDELYELAIEDDDLKVLRYILLYLHHQNLEVPTKISFQELVQVAVVIDKYDLRVALRFMGEMWLQQWKDKPVVSREWDSLLPQSRYENWLFVSWVFGEEDIFKRESAFLTRMSVIGEDGHLSFGIGFIVPESVSRAIAARRGSVIDAVSALCHNQLKKLADGSNAKSPPVCAQGGDQDSKEICDAIQYLLLERRLKKANLLPEDIRTTCGMSLRNLEGVFTSQLKGPQYPSGHPYCDVITKLLSTVVARLQNVEGPELAEFPSRASQRP